MVIDAATLTEGKIGKSALAGRRLDCLPTQDSGMANDRCASKLPLDILTT